MRITPPPAANEIWERSDYHYLKKNQIIYSVLFLDRAVNKYLEFVTFFSIYDKYVFLDS